jgi:peptidoglycan/xylan/chitin deacetylase (PgdA/CDA1 family)
MKNILFSILLFVYSFCQAQIGQIYLTFDDGPSLVMQTTLDTLKSRNVKAVFFVCGYACEVYPEIVKRALREGHIIASHSHRHPGHTTISNDSVVTEYINCMKAIKTLTGVDIKYFRFPGFGYNANLQAWVKDKGLMDVATEINVSDWDSPNNTATSLRTGIKNKLRTYIDNVVVLHVMPTPVTPPTSPTWTTPLHTNEMLGQLIDECRALGYEFYLLNPKLNYSIMDWGTGN